MAKKAIQKQSKDDQDQQGGQNQGQNPPRPPQ
jgi:hypothetical protein